jgi:large subunit ribosomal protein L9
MQIIFLKDVPKLGKKDDVKTMNDGYVHNFLLPRKLVEIATPQALAKLADRKASRDTDHAFHQARMETTAKSLDGVKVNLSALANEKGVLFKAITYHDVAPLFEKVSGVIIPEDVFHDVHIKSIGEHLLSVNIGNKTVHCTLIVDKK